MSLAVKHLLSSLRKRAAINFINYVSTRRIIIDTFFVNRTFSYLATTLLEEIISPINDKHRNPMETRVLEQLITPHLQNLRFASFSDAYLSLFPNFTKLRVLNLRRTAAGDSCLKSIGIYCNELR